MKMRLVVVVLLILIQGCIIRNNNMLEFPVYPEVYCEVNQHNELMISMKITIREYNELIKNQNDYEILDANFEYPVVPSPQYHVFAQIVFANCNIARDYLKVKQNIEIKCSCFGEKKV